MNNENKSQKLSDELNKIQKQLANECNKNPKNQKRIDELSDKVRNLEERLNLKKKRI